MQPPFLHFTTSFHHTVFRFFSSTLTEPHTFLPHLINISTYIPTQSTLLLSRYLGYLSIYWCSLSCSLLIFLSQFITSLIVIHAPTNLTLHSTKYDNTYYCPHILHIAPHSFLLHHQIYHALYLHLCTYEIVCAQSMYYLRITPFQYIHKSPSYHYNFFMEPQTHQLCPSSTDPQSIHSDLLAHITYTHYLLYLQPCLSHSRISPFLQIPFSGVMHCCSQKF